MAIVYLFILYCIEAGIFFLIVPWTRFWSMNPLLHYTPTVTTVVDNFFFRGFISGFGVVHLLIGGREIYRLVTGKLREPRS